MADRFDLDLGVGKAGPAQGRPQVRPEAGQVYLALGEREHGDATRCLRHEVVDDPWPGEQDGR
jgi:hypothetical protein